MEKILIIIPFLSVLLFLSSSFSVKANNVTSFPAFPEPVEGKSSTHYFISFNPETGSYFLLKPLDPAGMYVSQQGSKTFFNFTTSAISYYWEPEGSGWIKGSEYNYLSNLRIDDNTQFLYSSFDLFYDDGELFFQRAPIKESFLAQMKKVEMGAVMETVAKMVPVVMIAVAGFLGFRKAFNLLLRVLQGA